jgi:hypothetical protein
LVAGIKSTFFAVMVILAIYIRLKLPPDMVTLRMVHEFWWIDILAVSYAGLSAVYIFW